MQTKQTASFEMVKWLLNSVLYNRFYQKLAPQSFFLIHVPITSTLDTGAFTPGATKLPEAISELSLLLGTAGKAGTQAEWLSKKRQHGGASGGKAAHGS